MLKNQALRGTRIVVGGLLHEANTFSPHPTTMTDFEVFRGTECLRKLVAVPALLEAGAEVIPSLYANALPSGRVTEETYQILSGKILRTIEEAAPLDGIYLYLHGAMEVENLGSGEAYLLGRIREIVGEDVPIAAALDFHANNTIEFANACNVICGYRTAPHVDQAETQMRAATLLLQCIKEGFLPHPVMVRIPVITPGQALVTTIDPGKRLMAETIRTAEQPGIFLAELFGGNPWVDVPNMGPSTIVASLTDPSLANREAWRLARLFWEARGEFHFEVDALAPEAAIDWALRQADGPVFISDTGDNTTGGAPGDNAYLLELLLARDIRDVLLAGISDAPVITACERIQPGDRFTHCVGGTLNSRGRSVHLEGILQQKGRILGWCDEDAGRYAVIRTRGTDVLVTEHPCGIVSSEVLRSAGVEPSEYRIVVVKLGYLWDDLHSVARHAVLALTPGACCEEIKKIRFRNISRPIYPLDKDFSWDPVCEG